jgi:hypothetical protein
MSLKVITIVVLASMTLFSCGWKATQDDINKLEEQRSATLKAEETLVKKNQELEKTKREVEVEKNKRDDAQREYDRVVKDLAQHKIDAELRAKEELEKQTSKTNKKGKKKN